MTPQTLPCKSRRPTTIPPVLTFHVHHFLPQTKSGEILKRASSKSFPHWKSQGLSHQSHPKESKYKYNRASQAALGVKNPSANAGDPRDMSSIPGSGRSLGGGHGNPLQYSCLENPRDRGAWQATVHGIAKSEAQLKPLSTAHSTLVAQ